MFFKKQNPYKNAILGYVAGDVLGLPYEFEDRILLDYKGLIGYGTHNQPLGVWSDDTTFVYIFLSSLGDDNNFDINTYKNHLIEWAYEGKFTYNSQLPFDIGKQTSKAITNLKMNQEYFDLNKEEFNGNVALLRIFPYALYLKKKNIKPTLDNIYEFVSITNPHFISLMCCYYYALIIWYLDEERSRQATIQATINDFYPMLNNEGRLFFEDLLYPEKLDDRMVSNGYVLDTLKIVIYYFLKDLNLEESLKEVILTGGDTDSNAALVGGLNGFFINKTVKWKPKIVNLQYIEYLSDLYFPLK